MDVIRIRHVFHKTPIELSTIRQQEITNKQEIVCQ